MLQYKYTFFLAILHQATAVLEADQTTLLQRSLTSSKTEILHQTVHQAFNAAQNASLNYAISKAKGVLVQLSNKLKDRPLISDSRRWSVYRQHAQQVYGLPSNEDHIAHASLLARWGKKLRAARKVWLAKEAHKRLHSDKRKDYGMCMGWCKISIAFDMFSIGLAVVGLSCAPMSMALYYVLGVAVLMEEQGENFEDSIVILGQMVTTVGYGVGSFGDYPMQRKGLKLWHSLHSWLGVLLIGEQWAELITLWSEGMINSLLYITNSSLSLVIVYLMIFLLLGSSIVYSFDMETEKLICATMIEDAKNETPTANWTTLDSDYSLSSNCGQSLAGRFIWGKDNDGNWEPWGPKSWWADWQDALYFMIMSTTSVGYGDITPTTNWGKVLSHVMMQLATKYFGDWVDGVGKTVGKAEVIDGAAKGETKTDPSDIYLAWVGTCMSSNPEAVYHAMKKDRKQALRVQAATDAQKKGAYETELAIQSLESLQATEDMNGEAKKDEEESGGIENK